MALMTPCRAPRRLPERGANEATTALRTTSMTRPLSRRTLVVALAAIALTTTGCGGDASTSTTTDTAQENPSQAAPAPPAPDVINACAGASPRWRTLRVGSLHAAALGNGRNGVVFLNESGNDACPWLRLAQRLVARGFRAALFEYRSAAAAREQRAVRDTQAIAAALTQDGGRVALVGASLGGRIVFEAAAQRDAQIAAIVSLSGERTVQDYADILPAARRVRTPLLYVGSQQDALTDGARQPRQLRRAARSKATQLVLVPGSEHGTDLLFGDQGHAVSDRIEAFVRAQLP
jgi:dienelactone hydrolase